jgi:lipoprotein-releasing system permease protein
MKLAFKIAFRFLKSNKSQTLLIALGIAVGISVQIFIGSLINGLQASLLDATIGSASHITFEHVEKNMIIDDYRPIDEFIKDYSQITASTPSLTLGAFMDKDDNFTQVLYRGFPIERANEIYAFDEGITADSQLPQGNQVIIGSLLAEENNISIGDQISISPPEGQRVEITVSGIIDFKVNALNESWIIGSMALGQKIFNLPANQITTFEMQIEEPFDADLIAKSMNTDNKDLKLTVINWKDENAQLLSGLTGQSSSSYLIQVFVIISVVLGIASVLAITVLQKSKQIGILKAMGINDRTSSYIFLSQGFMLGLLGGILGILLGIGLLFAFTTFALNPDGSPVVPILIDPTFIIVSGFIAVIASTGAAIIPALKSKKLSPIEVIRNG